MHPSDLFALVVETDKLKSVYRRAYLTDSSRRENSAEHSWHLGLALMAMQPHMPAGLDLSHAIAMALVHDICEIGAGDISVYDTARQHKAAKEASYMRQFSADHADLGTRVETLWQEYEAQQTPESKWVKVADRILPFMMNLATAGRTWQEQGIRADQVLAINETIAEQFPELFAWLRLEVDKAVDRGWLKPARSGE